MLLCFGFNRRCFSVGFTYVGTDTSCFLLPILTHAAIRCTHHSEVCVPVPYPILCGPQDLILFKWGFPALTIRIFSICTPPIDTTPPLPGTIEAAWLPFDVLQVL